MATNSFEQLKELIQQQLTEIAEALEVTTDEASAASALRINQTLQRNLERSYTNVLQLLKTVRARYALNSEIIKQRLCVSRVKTDERITKTGAWLNGGSYRFKGNLFFRDASGRSCPNNDDYELRSHSEMFPTDFDMRSKHVWTMFDKKNVVMGVKQQLLDHVNLKLESQPKSRKRNAIDLHTKSLASLLASVDSSFRIDWQQLSSMEIQSRHSSYSCEAMWEVYLHPRINRSAWTLDEDTTLLATAKSYKFQDWEAIAQAVGQRSDYQCFVRFQTTLRYQIGSASKWSKKDDDRLKSVVLQNTTNSIIDWKSVMQYFPDKSKSSVIGRYTYVLHPRISRDPFTVKEDMKLFAAVKEFDGKFYTFPRDLFPNRSLSQLRMRYYNVLAQRDKTDSWSVEDDSKLMEFVTNHGKKDWVGCASFLGNHTRTGCRTRFLTITRFIEQNPGADLKDLPRRQKLKHAPVTEKNFMQCLEKWQEDPSCLEFEEESKNFTTIKKALALESQEPWSLRDDTKLMEFVTTNGTLEWAKCAIYIGNKTKHNCRSRYYYIKRFLAKNPNANVEEFPRKSTKKIVKLIGQNKQAYQYFKYAYNLQLGQNNTPEFAMPSNDLNLRLVVRALRPQLAFNLENLVEIPVLPSQICQVYSQMLKTLPPVDYQPYLLPPNWSTIMGFRALCILPPDLRNGKKQEILHYDTSADAVQIFRQRLRALFYRTTLLSRLDPNLIENLRDALPPAEATSDKYVLQKAEPQSEDEENAPNIKEEPST